MSTMKQSFARTAPETYEEREKRLQDAADLIEQRLAANDTPQMHLRPKGQLRRYGDAVGKEAANRQKMSIEDELAQIRKERAQRQEIEPPNKSKSL